MGQSIFETLGESYTTVGDYRLPDLNAGETEPLLIGKYGRSRVWMKSMCICCGVCTINVSKLC